MSRSFLATLVCFGRLSSVLAGSRTSSAKCIVSSTSTPSDGRIAARYCLPRMTKVATPIRSDFSIALASSAYGFFAVSSAGAR